MKIAKKIMSFIMAVALCVPLAASAVPAYAKTAAKYITVTEFADALVKECGLRPVDIPLISGNIDALMLAGIIKEGDFKSYTKNLTRADAAVLTNRADEYLNKTKVDEDTVTEVIEKRISDISAIKTAKQADVAKAFYKGYIKGYSNGTYSANRTLKGTGKITRDGALNMIKMLKDKSLRAKMSPDGQLIRTTNLPKYAKYYPYILASYPNSYYDWKFHYQTVKRTTWDDKLVKFVSMKDYASPASFYKDIDHFDADVTDECIDVWMKKINTYMEHIFNVDYRTIGEKWVQETFAQTFNVGADTNNLEQGKNMLRDYVTRMKKNKTIVESSVIAVDKSSFYYFDGQYFARVYVKYRINSSVAKCEKSWGNDNILYPDAQFNGFELGKWKTCCFDVDIAGNQLTKDSISKGVCTAYLYESVYTMNKIK